MIVDYKPIAESNNFIVLDKYTKLSQVGRGLRRLPSVRQFWNALAVNRTMESE